MKLHSQICSVGEKPTVVSKNRPPPRNLAMLGKAIPAASSAFLASTMTHAAPSELKAPVGGGATLGGASVASEPGAYYLRSHTGLGGTIDRGVAEAAATRRATGATAAAAPLVATARARRPNPPNTELRRRYERSDLPLVILQCVGAAQERRAPTFSFHPPPPLHSAQFRSPRLEARARACIGRWRTWRGSTITTT